MKNPKLLYVLAPAAVITLLSLGRCNAPETKTVEEKPSMTPEQQVEKGKYLVLVGGCNDCHTPKKFTDKGPVFNEELTLSGHPQDEKLPDIDPTEITPGKWYLASSGLNAWVGPWGVSFAANLTPDSLTGTGAWTEELFLKILRTGKFMGIESGRPIMPPMPWDQIGKMTDDDLKAIFAYIKSLKPIRNTVPSYIPPNEIASMNKKS